MTLKLALPGVLAALTGLCQQAWQWCLLGLCASAVSPRGCHGHLCLLQLLSPTPVGHEGK